MIANTDKREKLNGARLKALIDNTAQSIFKDLQELENRREQVKHRWIWELLQNARDAARSGSELEICIEVRPDVLVFRHNGKRFSDEEISHLIFHGSSKQNNGDNESVGHFGSGFISTHLLSKFVDVQGRLEDGSSFSFELNREANSADELKRLMDASWDGFIASLDGTQDHTFSTQFTYPLSPEATTVVTSGIDALDHCAAYILAFNRKIHTLQITVDSCCTRFVRGRHTKLDDNVTIEEIDISRDSVESERRSVATINGHNVAVAVMGIHDNHGTRVNLSTDVPRLFLAFPLHDSEDLCFPAVINSESFGPNEDRGGVYLGTGDTDAVRRNEEILGTACQLLVKLAGGLLDCNWSNTASLALLEGVQHKGWIRGDWYHELLRETFIERLRDTSLLRTSKGELIKPKESWIPAQVNENDCVAIWELLDSRKDGENRVPVPDDLSTWFLNLQRWNDIANCLFPESMTINDLAAYAAEKGDITNLATDLSSDVKPLEWLTKLYELILNNEKRDLFDDFEMLPDQNGKFQCRNSLTRDKGLDESLKDIAQAIGIDIRSQLLHSHIRLEGIIGLLSHPIEQDELLKEIIARLNKESTEPLGAEFEEVNLSLFRWIIENDQLELLKSFPFITRGQDVTMVNTESVVKCYMGPVGAWQEGLRKYSELFPKSRILSDRYYEAKPEELIWNKLASIGLISLSPVVKVSEQVIKFLGDPSEETDHRSLTPIEQTHLLFLHDDDSGLIDTSRKSRTRTIAFLKFLLEYALDADADVFTEDETDCECGEKHRYYVSSWLSRLREVKWLFGGHNRSVKPTAASFADVVRSDAELKKCLTDSTGLQFLKVLGVSPSDLSLRLLSQDESQRVSYIKSLASLQEATGNDPNRLAAFASAVLNDPQLIDLASERAKTKTRIHQNQRIGAEIERLLAENLRQEGLRVTRTGIGSDYEVDTDFNENGEEIILTIQGGAQTHLIEIKCTRTDDVRMTPKQAEVASTSQNRFSLCVVELSSQDLDHLDIPAVAKFVMDIGVQVEPLWKNYQTIEHSKNQTQMQLGDITLEISKDITRFRVSRSAWGAGVSFTDFVQYLKNRRRP